MIPHAIDRPAAAEAVRALVHAIGEEATFLSYDTRPHDRGDSNLLPCIFIMSQPFRTHNKCSAGV